MPMRLPPVRYAMGKLVGIVSSVANHKTAVVKVPRWFTHPKVGRDIRRTSKLWAHDEFNLCSVGDVVRIEECRALSKKKAHVVAEILHKEDGTPPPTPFPKW